MKSRENQDQPRCADMDVKDIVAASERIESDLGRLRSTVSAAVMFVDLVGSIAYKALHPSEEKWLPRLAKFLIGVSRIVSEHGRVVKYIGDEVMAIFEGNNAVLDAEYAAERILQFCEQFSSEQFAVKIAIDFGSVSLLDYSKSARDTVNIKRLFL